ncbi:MAG: DUF2339 domain-containing protein, partial [Patescibacteria group bacterium]|nr:DUF2339 domain-containing protein [Patescibacteria group bacterium]
MVLNNRIEELKKEVNILRNQKTGDSRQNQAEIPVANQEIATEKAFEQNLNDQSVLSSQLEKPSASADSKINQTDQSQPSNQNQNEPDALSSFFKWFAIDWPMKTGAFFLILALGWFVTYAFINDWIGPVGRVSLGLTFGLLLLILGFYISKKLQAQGNTLAVVGAITILITILAGIEFYGFFSPVFALLVMFLVVIFLALVSFKQQNKSLAIVTLILGALVPLFVFEEADELMIMLYLFVLSAGVIWLMRVTNWKVLTLISLLIVAFYSNSLELIRGLDSTWQNILFAFIFTALFYSANIVTIVKDRIASKIDLFIAGITGIIFLYWMIIIAPSQLEVFLILLGALVFALTSYIIFKLTQLKQPVFVYAGVSLMLIIAATALQFEGSVLTAAYLVEFSVLIIVALYLFRNQTEKKLLYMGSMALFAVPVLMSLENVNELLFENIGFIGTDEIANLFILVFVALLSFILAIASWLFVAENDQENYRERIQLSGFFYGIFGIYSIIIVWSILHLTMTQEYLASMMSLIIYTIAGMIFYVKGKKDGKVSFKVIGGLFFGLVIARLLLVEFWQMDMVTKIISFF